MKLVGFKALIETDGVRSIKIFWSRTPLKGVGLVSNQSVCTTCQKLMKVMLLLSMSIQLFISQKRFHHLLADFCQIVFFVFC